MKLSRIAPLVLVLSTTGAFAQTTTTPTDPAARTAPTARPATVAPTQEMKGAWHVKDFYQTNVYNMAGEKIGDINDILVDEGGKVTAFIIGVGGFLGIGAKDVALSPASFQVMPASERESMKLKISMSKDELKNAAEFKPYKEPATTTGQAPSRDRAPMTPPSQR